MHTLLGLSSVLLVVLSGYLTLAVLRRLRGWSSRRDLQFLVLMAPIVSLGLAIAGLHHFSGRVCFLRVPPWDQLLGLALPLIMTLVALGGVVLGLVRIALMACVVRRRGLPADGELQSFAAALADRLGVSRPRVLLCAYDHPLALISGFCRPTLLLSTWMVERLDRRELESVLAHELAHAARRDYLVIWLATMLRDAFCYLPTSWIAYRQLQHEKELACDDVAVGLTQRPLALASALAKVWQQSLERPVFGLAQRFVGAGEAIEGRIERLLAARGTSLIGAAQPRSRVVALGAGALGLAGLLALEVVNVIVLLAPMGCGPAAPLRRFF